MSRYIDADILWDKISRAYQFEDKRGVLGYVKQCLNEAPTANVQEVKHGRWIDGYPEDYERGITAQFKCSECGRRAGISQTRTYKYCPKCGAKMDKEE